MTLGWIIPPPKTKSNKSEKEFERERKIMVKRLVKMKILCSKRIIEAMLRVPREKFMPKGYIDYAYYELPFPLPGNGKNQTISCPHSYPLFYEALELKENDKFLEIGTGSGYGAALAKEIVRKEGLVVTIEINPITYQFAKRNLEKLGYKDIIIILGDGGNGYPSLAPYDKIAITAACPQIPKPLIEQLKIKGKLIAPLGKPNQIQKLILIEKEENNKIKTKVIDEVLYVPLKGKYGWNNLQSI